MPPIIFELTAGSLATWPQSGLPATRVPRTLQLISPHVHEPSSLRRPPPQPLLSHTLFLPSVALPLTVEMANP